MNTDDIRIEKDEFGTEIYVFDPYNHVNVEIKQEEVEAILRKYGINEPIINFTLYKRAFIHQSYTRRPEIENKQNNIVIVPKPDGCLPLHTKSNERLEFVGDGVLECITKFYLYSRFSKEDEGFMTEKKIALVKNEAIGKLAMEIGLHKWFILSKHAETKQIRTNLKKLGCLFEAFIGAIFLDFKKLTVDSVDKGFRMAEIFVRNVFETHVDWMNLIQNDDNYKNILQVRIQKEFKVTPHYIEIEPPNPETGYHMGVYLCLGQPVHNLKHLHSCPCSTFSSFMDIHNYMSQHGRIFVFLGEGKHKTKKKAEQMACHSAIQTLKDF